MIKIEKHVAYLIVTLFFSGCIGTAHNEKIVESYSLSAIDVMEDMTLDYSTDQGYSLSIIGATVFAVGYNDEFIIIKQHPRMFPKPSDKSITNYFIIPLKDKVNASPEKNVIGLLTQEEFELKRKELGIPDGLAFTKVFKELE